MASVGKSKSTVKKVRFALDGAIVEQAGSGAQESLQKIANKASNSLANKQSTTGIWSISLRNVLPSAGTLMCLAKPLTKPLIKSAQWLYSFGPTARLERKAERMEREWREAVRRAKETQAQHEFMEDLSAARLRSHEESQTVVTSALGHRSSPRTAQFTIPEVDNSEDEISLQSNDTGARLTSKVGVGSIFSNTPVPPPPPPNPHLSKAPVPGFHLRKPTEALRTNIYKPHKLLRDPDAYEFLDQDPRGDRPRKIRSSGSTNLTKPNVPTAPGLNISIPANVALTEHATSDSDSDGTDTSSSSFHASPSSTLPNSRATSRTSMSVAAAIDPVDRVMKGDADGMVFFGRWKHHKDAPLSFVREMIEKDIRGAGSQSLYGCGILKIEDHPLVPYYNARLKKAQLDETHDAQKAPPLSPILMAGGTAATRLAMRTSTPASYGMTGDSVFKTIGFAQRTRSMCSVSPRSVSPSNDSVSSTTADSNISDNSSSPMTTLPEPAITAESTISADPAIAADETQPKQPSSKLLITQDMYPPPNPDPEMNWKEVMAITGDSDLYIPPRYIRKPQASVTKEYIAEHCVPRPHLAKVSASGPGTPQLSRHFAPLAMSRDATKRPQHQQQRQTSKRPVALPMSRDKTRRPQVPFRPRNQQQEQEQEQEKPSIFRAPLKKSNKLDIVAAEDAEDAIASDSESESGDESEQITFEKIVVPKRGIMVL